MIDSGFIKLHRQIMTWEWWHRPATRLVFITCLLMANWKESKFEGNTIPRGSFVTSLRKLSAEAGVSERQARTALRDLQTTQELTLRTTPKYTVITVNNYDLYQSNDTASDTQTTHKRQTGDTQTTTIEERKKERIKEYTLSGEPGEEKHPYGIYNNVYLTAGEMNELIKAYPGEYQDMIENLSAYMKNKGKYYADHFAIMMKWKREDKKAETYDYRKDVI